MELKTMKPGFCCFGIIDSCMLRCKMCEKWKEDIFTGENPVPPTLDQWKQCVDDLAQMVEFPFELDLGGGEALMYKGLLELIEYSVNKGFSTSIASNGYLIDEEMAKRLNKAGLKMVSLSLDSLNEKTHDYLRGVDGVYKRVMKAIEYLDRHCKDTYVNLCCVLYEINQEEVLDLIEWANNDKRIGLINFMAAMQPNNTQPQDNWWEKEHSFLWPKNPKRTSDILDKIIDLKSKGYKIGNPASQLKAFKAYYENPNRFVKKRQCNLERCVLVSSIGDVFLCYDFEKLGNIKTDRLIDIWYSDKAEKVRQDIANCSRNCHHLLNCFDEFDEDFKDQ